MRTELHLAVLWMLVTAPVSAQQETFQDTLLDRMVGNWVMKGTIAGDSITHDLVFEWVLGHQYMRFHEVAREKDSTGAPAYEAIVFIGRDEPNGRYACLWLDVTGGGGLTGPLGFAKPEKDKLTFVFGEGEESTIYTTFAYKRDSDTWDWLIDIVKGEKTRQFARVSLARQ